MSPLVLAVDATAEFGSLALVRGREVIEEALLHSPDGFAHVLFGQIERLLARHGLEIGDIDRFAAAAGPGSFTGVRVGLAAVKGLAEAAGKPAAAVSNLRAVASFGEAAVRAALLDARRGEIYGGLYDAGLRPLGPEVVTRFPAWLESLPEGDVEILSTDLAVFGPALTGRRARQIPRALAAAVGRIAAAGDARDPALIDANYVRRSDAEKNWRDRE